MDYLEIPQLKIEMKGIHVIKTDGNMLK
jgi:hypothetical protein